MPFTVGRTGRALVAGFAVLWLSAPAVGQTTNLPPQCPLDPSLTVTSGRPLVLPGSPCSDPEGQPVTLILVDGPSHGVLSGPAADGSRTYTSTPGFVGTDLIRFKASNGTAESPVSTLTIRVVGGGGGGGAGGARAGRIQQQVEAGAMIFGQRLPIWIYVSDLAAGQDVSVQITPSEPVQRVDPGCTPDGAAYVCAIHFGPLFSKTTLRLEFVAGAPGRFTLTSRIVHSGVSDTDAVTVLPRPEAGRTVALVDEGSCTHGRPITARTPGASAFSSICPGRTLPMGSRFKTTLLRASLYWTYAGRMRGAKLKDPRGGANAAATIAQPRGRALELRLAKPRRCRGYEGIEVGSNDAGELHIVGRLVRVTFRKGSAGVTEYCDRALISQRSGTIVIRDLVHHRTVRLSGAKSYVVRAELRSASRGGRPAAGPPMEGAVTARCCSAAHERSSTPAAIWLSSRTRSIRATRPLASRRVA